jgi:hypothetical protein
MFSPSFRQATPGRLDVREGGGCLSVFGIPFCAAGLAVILMSIGIIPIDNPPSSTARPFLLLMGFAFASIGGVLVFGRKWTTLTAADRTVLVQYGFLVPMREKILRLDGYTTVRIDFLPGDSDSADQYPLTLKGPAVAPFRVCGSTKYAESRECAVAIGKLLDFKIEDATSARAVPLSPAQADLSFQHRQRIEHQRDELVIAPASMRSRVSESNGVVTIVIPAARVHPALFLFHLIPVTAVVLLFDPFSRFFRQSRTPDGIAWILLSFLVVAFGVLPAYAALSAYLKSRFGRTTISASTAGLRIDERRVWKTRTLASLSATDIMDVDYSTVETLAEIERRRPTMVPRQTGKGTELVVRMVRALIGTSGVTIKTRKGLTTVGAGLEDRELRYLHYMIRRALVQ